MKKIWILMICCGCFAGLAEARVRLITDTGYSVSDTKSGSASKPAEREEHFNENLRMKCRSYGYPKFGCPEGYYGIEPCPFNEIMFRVCCPVIYDSTEGECLARGMQPSMQSCGGLFKCLKID